MNCSSEAKPTSTRSFILHPSHVLCFTCWDSQKFIKFDEKNDCFLQWFSFTCMTIRQHWLLKNDTTCYGSSPCEVMTIFRVGKRIKIYQTLPYSTTRFSKTNFYVWLTLCVLHIFSWLHIFISMQRVWKIKFLT